MREQDHLVQKLKNPKSYTRVFMIVLVVALLTGIGTGYILSSNSSKGENAAVPIIGTNEKPKTAQQDNRTFRDFAQGKVAKKEVRKGDNYSEGTHVLVRDNAVPVTLTSSVVDLSQYEGKKIKVYGETQKAIEEGWLMDVGRIEEVK